MPGKEDSSYSEMDGREDSQLAEDRKHELWCMQEAERSECRVPGRPSISSRHCGPCDMADRLATVPKDVSKYAEGQGTGTIGNLKRAT